MESSLKLLDYINKVAKEPMMVNGQPFGVPAPTRVTLSESFFIKDDCAMCGRCCLNETTAWTESGMEQIETATLADFSDWDLPFSSLAELTKDIRMTPCNINGKDTNIYVYPSDKKSQAMVLSWPDRKESPRCHWLFEKDGTYRCRIHPVRSVTCRMPHIRFFYNSKTLHTSIGVSQYGRNWALKCPVSLSEVDELSVGSKLQSLLALRDVADDIGVETYLPEIIQYLIEGGRRTVSFSSRTRKLFNFRR